MLMTATHRFMVYQLPGYGNKGFIIYEGSIENHTVLTGNNAKHFYRALDKAAMEIEDDVAYELQVDIICDLYRKELSTCTIN